MRKINIALCLIFYFAFGFTFLYAQTEKVERVGDDYILMLSSGKKVRLIGIDIPRQLPRNDIINSFYRFSQNFTKELLEGKRINLEFDIHKTNNQGVFLAYVYLEDATLVNEKIIQEGFACAIKQLLNKKYLERFLSAEEEAKNNQRGLWQLLSYLEGRDDFSAKITLAQIPDGVYIGSDSTMLGKVTVKAYLKNGRIEKIDILENTYSHCKGIDKAFTVVPPEIVAKQSLDVDGVSGATVSSQSIKYAIVEALSKAR